MKPQYCRYLLLALASACLAACSNQAAPSTDPAPTTMPASRSIAVDCTPPLLFRPALTLSSALNELPPGETLEVAFSGTFTEQQRESSVSAKLQLQRGQITIECPTGKVTYQPDGRMILDWGDKSQTVIQRNVPPVLSISLGRDYLGKDYAFIDLVNVHLAASQEDLPEADRTRFFYLSATGHDPSKRTFTCRITKSNDCLLAPMIFSVDHAL